MVEATEIGARGTAVCELVTVPAREGLEAVAILCLREGVGPVLHDRHGDTLGFVVPRGTVGHWSLPGSACAQAVGPLDAAEPPVAGSGWLIAPGATTADATEPERLRAALDEAIRMLAVVDGCGPLRGSLRAARRAPWLRRV